MTYSAVIHPPGLSSFIQGGKSRLIEAVQSTTVFPCSHSTDPAGVWVKPRVIVIGRSWSGERPSFRMGSSFGGFNFGRAKRAGQYTGRGV